MIGVCVGAVVVLMACCPAWGQMRGAPQSGESREWGQRYGQYCNILLKRDFSSFRKMVAPGATWVMANGRKLNPAQMEKELARKLDAVKPNTQLTMNVTKITVAGKEATIERTQVLAGFYADSKGNRHRAFDGSGWEDRWVKTAQGWKIKSAKQFNETLTVDGRPGDPYTDPARKKAVKPAQDKGSQRRSSRT